MFARTRELASREIADFVVDNFLTRVHERGEDDDD
jgi:hypothetical protein